MCNRIKQTDETVKEKSEKKHANTDTHTLLPVSIP